MKKLLLMTLILTLVMSFSFTGCGGNAADDNDDNTAVEQTQDDADDKDDADDQNDDENDDSDADDQNDTDDQDDDDDDDKAPVQNNQNGQSGQNNAGTAQPAPSPAPAPQPEVNSAPSKDDAKKYVGKSLSAMIAEIGSPISSSYAPSCMGDGEDGELKYSGFTVYTYRESGQEKVIDVE